MTIELTNGDNNKKIGYTCSIYIPGDITWQRLIMTGTPEGVGRIKKISFSAARSWLRMV